MRKHQMEKVMEAEEGDDILKCFERKPELVSQPASQPPITDTHM
jgi:hypothetical protein